ncbi:MAG TPA: ABC transporter substrate-binding protein [Mycobacteriales bacterium]|nr:ABC transporter substrate-binding protein [Mycobacteriales bacterium]
MLPVDGRRPRPRFLLAVALAAALAAGCSSGAPAAGQGGQQAARTDASLRGVCPATVVVQASWYTQIEHFVAYELLGRGYTVDAARKRVTGPLVAHGVDTGVKIEIRAGGPAIGFQQVSAQMYADRSITLGMIPLDEAIQNSKDQPVTGVMTPYDVDPLVIMWDPAAHPTFNSIADIGQTDTKVLFFNGERTYMDYLLGSGLLRPSQVDGSYDGSPDRLAASRGAIAVQGFATSEPWKFEHEVKAWGKPLTYQLVADSGYPNYRNLLAIRAGDKGRLAGCLRKLVPMLQQATVDFMARPDPLIRTVLSIVDSTRQAYTDSVDRSRHAVDVMRDDDLVTNGRTPMVGDFDLAPGGRVQRLLRIDVPIFTGQHKQLAPDLVPTDIATNEFLDPAISLPRAK